MDYYDTDSPPKFVHTTNNDEDDLAGFANNN